MKMKGSLRKGSEEEIKGRMKRREMTTRNANYTTQSRVLDYKEFLILFSLNFY